MGLNPTVGPKNLNIDSDGSLNPQAVIAAISTTVFDRPTTVIPYNFLNSCMAVNCIFTRQPQLNLKAVIAIQIQRAQLSPSALQLTAVKLPA